MKNFFYLLIFSALLVGCGEDDGVIAPPSSSGITISGQITAPSKLNVSALSPAGLSDYTFYCVAFNADADSCSDQLDDDGNFECTGIPADTAFGCFVKDSTSIVATLEFVDTTTGFENETSASTALKGSVSLGSVTLNTTTGKATVSKSVLDGKVSTESSSLTPLDFQNTSWDLSCVNGSDTQMNSVCSEFVTDSPTVFFRVLKATKNSDGKVIYGLGVWKDEAAFTGCGEIDMVTAMKSSIESGDSITFDVVEHAAAFTNAHAEGQACETRDGSAPDDNEPTSIESYYTLQKLVNNGGSYTLREEDEYTNSECTYTQTLAVTFNPVSETLMYGAFDLIVKESGSGCTYEGTSAKFTVKFTKSE